MVGGAGWGLGRKVHRPKEERPVVGDGLWFK